MTAMDYLSMIREGLPRSTSPKRIAVVGAGMAGLTAAYELLRAGHEPIVLEARQRVGGRIYTLREPFAPGLHAEAGAMRFPRSHALTMAYIEKFALPVTPFTMGNPQGYYFIRGRKLRMAEAQTEPDRLGFELPGRERGKSPSQLWAETLAPILEQFAAKGEAAWDEIVPAYDQYSTREFLEASGWSEDAIEMYGLLANQESRLNTAFIELLRAEISHSFNDMFQIQGGSDRLPQAFLPAVQEHIRFGARVTAIEQSAHEVTLSYQTLAGPARLTADYAIITLPLSVLRHIEVQPAFSRPKQRAIRQLPYDASGKIFLQCRRRFWEEDEGIFGGSTVTDLAIRNIHYPEHGRETGRGVLIASYTWAGDAQRWGWLDPRERLVQAIENVAQVHPQIRDEFEVGASHMWQNDEFAGGAFALFDPGHMTLLHPAIIAAEGRLHFAGEHASLSHRWVQGAIESGLRAAAEIHFAGREGELPRAALAGAMPGG
jgi:monoamine oxidase